MRDQGLTRTARRRAIVLLVLSTYAVFLGAGPASAQTTTTSTISDAVQALRDDPLYVADGAIDSSVLTDQEQAQISEALRAAETPVYIAVLPESAADEVGGNLNALPRALYQELRQPGTYAVLAGTRFTAQSSERALAPGEADALARDAVLGSGGDVRIAMLDFVDRVEVAAADSSSVPNRGGGGGLGGLLPLLLLLGLGGGVLLWSRQRSTSRRKEMEREQAEELAQVRGAVDEDITAYGEQLDELDLDVRAGSVDEDTRADWAHALEIYERAKALLAAARRPEDVRAVTEALEEGRYALARVRARIEGRALPQRRPPCFFDPRHGPSVQDALWAPPGGMPRDVPVCAADAQRIADGYEPEVRTVPVPGGRQPYWDAGPAYAPWAGGYFGGYGSMLLPGLLIGTMLGGSFGAPMVMGGWGGDFGGDGGDYGGGDFGGGGGDFGDFGGGDFGGGGDF